MPHRSLRNTSVFEQLRYAARRVILEVYVGILLPQQAVSRIMPTQYERNQELRQRQLRGESLTLLAEDYGLSAPRVWQIAHVDASSRQARISPWISFRTLRVIILSEGHLRRVLHEYAEYYNTRQPHQGLE